MPLAVLREPARALAWEGVVVGSALVVVAEAWAWVLRERESRQELPAGIEGMALHRIWVEARVHRVPGSQASRRLPGQAGSTAPAQRHSSLWVGALGKLVPSTTAGVAGTAGVARGARVPWGGRSWPSDPLEARGLRDNLAHTQPAHLQTQAAAGRLCWP